MKTRKKDFAVKFAPIVLKHNFPRAGSQKQAVEIAREMPRGKGRYWGIPFNLAGEGARANAVRLAKGKKVEVRAGRKRATHLCFLHYWEGTWSRTQGDAGGNVLARYTIVYSDGERVVVPVRLRYHLGARGLGWGQNTYAAVRMNDLKTLDFMSEEARRNPSWGHTQTDSGGGSGPAWVYAHENPRPDVAITSIEMRGLSKDAVCVLALTFYSGPGHPLRHNARRYFALQLPKGEEVTEMDVDMGVLVRDAGLATPRDSDWVKSPVAGLGAGNQKTKKNVRLLEASAADGATLTVKTRSKTKKSKYQLSLGEAQAGAVAKNAGARLTVSHAKDTWVHVTIRDGASGKPIPTRVHISGRNGEYYAPYGHHTVVNDNWFEDYGADIQLGQMPHAYVQGNFQTKLPVGEIYVEVAKGFEYKPLRRKLTIKPGQRKLELTLDRWTDRSKDGWVTADTHVHFISPHTAWLQGQCEGLNLINLLASQWGRLFTNVGDITGEVGVEKDNTIVWTGTENRNHMLGHISMLGTHGDPVYPMCCGGPGEAYIGDPDERAMTEWADECRRKEGVVIRPHFPQPNLENPVDIILGKFDGLEIRAYNTPGSGPLDAYMLREYYRYLNCGYRVACVGGTDKMSAGMPVGGVRTYAKLSRNRPFDFEKWGEAVRAGRTYSTPGPLIDLTVDGHTMGEEIRLSGGRGTVEVKAVAESAWPIHRLEIVKNGEIVASTARKDGTKKLTINTRIKIDGSSWIAARCGSTMTGHHCWPIFLAAHTSPVYIVVPRTDLFSPSDATYMLTLIDGGLTYLDTLSVRYDEKRHREMKAIYKSAHDALHARMSDHAHDHSH